jgi:hypothetical protein
MTEHKLTDRIHHSDISLDALAILRELIDDPDPDQFLERQSILGTELVRLIDLETPVKGRHFRLICGIPEITGLMAGMMSELETRGATVCVSVHYHVHRILNENPLIETSAIYHSYDEPDDRPSTAIIASSCLGNVKSSVSSLVSVAYDRKFDISEGLIVASPVMTSDVKTEFLRKAGSICNSIEIKWFALSTDHQRVQHGLPIPGVGGDPWTLSSIKESCGVARLRVFVNQYRAHKKRNAHIH